MTDIDFVLPDPELAQYTWVYENEHGPASQPPLTRQRTFGASPEPGSPPTRLIINGYSYYRAGPAGEMPMPGALPDLGEATALETWNTKWLPEVNALFDELTGFEATSVRDGEWRETLDRQATEFGRVFAGVHGECVLTSGKLAQDFVDGYCHAFGEARRADAHALLQGFPNSNPRPRNCALDAGPRGPRQPGAAGGRAECGGEEDRRHGASRVRRPPHGLP